MFLILLAGVVVNVIVTLVNGWLRQPLLGWLPVGLLAIAFGLIVYQLNTRGFDFDYEGWLPRDQFPEYEAKSKAIQREILGDAMYARMEQKKVNR